jgi:hypothetical protein
MKLTNPPRNSIGDRAGPEWLQFAADAYLDHRHRNWVIGEELGDVRFLPDAGAVLIHRKRAEHIARTLLGGRDVLVLEDALALPVRTSVGLVRLPPAQPQRLVIPARNIHLRDIVGWLGIVAGAAVFVLALTVPLDDSALVVALMLALRCGLLILHADS